MSDSHWKMFYDAAIWWYSAERRARPAANPLPWDQLPEHRRLEIIERCRNLLLGEVRRSECGPGDLEIWNGRLRGNEMIRDAASAIPKKPVMPRKPGEKSHQHGVREMRVRHVYDTVTIDSDFFKNGGWCRAFGNANVGIMSRTNIQCGGCLGPGDSSFVAAYAYVTAFWTDQEDLVYDFMRSYTLTLEMGEWSMQDMPIIDYFTDLRPFREVFHVRQSFHATLRTEPEHATRLSSLLRSSFDIVIHIEGAQVREVC